MPAREVDWLTRQIEKLEAQVREERRRLNAERVDQALKALIALSLPELHEVPKGVSANPANASPFS